jgi:ubiquinone/menaquinone biosynthesis C-methylase UbiE
MSVFSSLPPAEQARQLANPEGPVGLEVAEWLNGNNRQSNVMVIALLGIQPGFRALEIGFGNGRAASDVIGQSVDVRYHGIDSSPTMFDEATRFNAALVAAGRASFHLASAEHMPFADASFDRVFAIGVIHFWRDPIAPLVEIRRVMRPGGLAVMQTQPPDSRSPREFARPEFGFHLRSADEWQALFRQAGFGTVEAQNIESEGITPDGTPSKRYTIRMIARP